MIKYKPFEIEYLDQVLLLLEPLWRHLTISERKAYFDWKYLSNPNSKGFPLVFLAIHSELNKVIGIRGVFLVQYFINGSNFVVASGADAIISEEYRSRGFFKELSKFSISHLKKMESVLFLVSISSNPQSIGSYYQNECVKISERVTLYHFAKPLVKRKDYHNFKFTLSTQLNVDEVSMLSQCINSNNLLSFDYNKRQLKWRFDNPNNNYKYVYTYNEEEKLVSFISYCKLDKKRIYIVDYLYEKEEYFKFSIQKLEKEENVFITLFEVFKAEEKEKLTKLLKPKTFTSLKKLFKLAVSNDIAIRSLNDNTDLYNTNFEKIDFQNIDNWHFTLICSDGI